MIGPLGAWRDGPVTVLAGDCRERLRELPHASVDAIVTDPPYGQGEAEWDRTSIEFHAAWLAAAWPLLRPGAPILAFCSRRLGWQLYAAADRLAIPVRGQLVWVHRQGFPRFPDDPRAEHEPIAWFGGGLRAQSAEVRAMRSYADRRHALGKVVRREESRGFKQYVYQPDPAGPIAGTVFEAGRNRPAEKLYGHPTQKPVDITAYLVALACPPGGVLLDCFAGSGTTLAVARRSGRLAIGVEKRLDYLPLIQRRVAEAAMPLLEELPAAAGETS
jgi:site-specific DNA-methyltransferase (adenine-specific)